MRESINNNSASEEDTQEVVHKDSINGVSDECIASEDPNVLLSQIQASHVYLIDNRENIIAAMNRAVGSQNPTVLNESESALAAVKQVFQSNEAIDVLLHNSADTESTQITNSPQCEEALELVKKAGDLLATTNGVEVAKEQYLASNKSATAYSKYNPGEVSDVQKIAYINLLNYAAHSLTANLGDVNWLIEEIVKSPVQRTEDGVKDLCALIQDLPDYAINYLVNEGVESVLRQLPVKVITELFKKAEAVKIAEASNETGVNQEPVTTINNNNLTVLSAAISSPGMGSPVFNNGDTTEVNPQVIEDHEENHTIIKNNRIS